MRDAAAASGRRIRHHQRRSALKQILDLVFLDVARELDAGMGSVLPLHRFDVAGCLRMVAARNDQLDIRKTIGNPAKRFDHQFQFFVCAPFPERENAMLGIATP